MLSQDSIRCTRSGCFALEVQNLPTYQVPSVKRVTHGSWILLDLSTSHHTCIHMLGHHLGYGGIPTLRSPHSGQTLNLLPRGQPFRLPLPPASKGVDQWTFLPGCFRAGHRNKESKV